MFPGNNIYVKKLPWVLLHIRHTPPAPSVTDLQLLHTINHFNKAAILRVKILTSLFGHDCQLTMFEVTWNKHNKFTGIVGDICCRDISGSLCFMLLTHVVQGQQDLFHNNAPKNDSPPCSMMNLLSLWDEITCCVSSWGRVIRSDYQAMHRIFDYLQGMLITLLLDFCCDACH